MNSSSSVFADEKVKKVNIVSKITTLNPNAAEFVPSALKYARTTKNSDVKKLEGIGSSRNVVLDLPESSVSDKSEDEANQHWHNQLPDDITPDFKVIGAELQGSGNLPIASLSINGNVRSPGFSGLIANQKFGVREGMPSFTKKDRSLSGEIGYSGSAYAEEQSSATSMMSASNSWGKTSIDAEQHSITGKERNNKNASFHGTSLSGLICDSTFLQNSTVDPIEHLTPDSPGFASDRLSNAYYENGHDLNTTLELLTQHKHKSSGDFGMNINSRPLATPTNSMLGRTAMHMAHAQDGLSEYTREKIMHRSNSLVTRREIDVALKVRQLALLDSHSNNGYAVGGAGSTRTSQLLANSLYADKGAAQSGAVWLETGDTVEPGGQDYEFANLQNVYFEKENQAYLSCHKTSAKELAFKRLLDDMQMKAMTGKPKVANYRQRNTLFPELQSRSQVPDCLINLHDLPMPEALDYLNSELSILQSKARSSGQKLHALISLGIVQHTKAAQTSVSLVSMAVEMYLSERGLNFTRLQPDLLLVAIY